MESIVPSKAPVTSTILPWPSSWTFCLEVPVGRSLSGEPPSESSTRPCPTRSQRGRGYRVRRPPSGGLSIIRVRLTGGQLTFFLNCLWMASSASLMVTPLEFRAVTSNPRGKWRSIFLTGGLMRRSLRMSLSSMVLGEVFSFLG